jgi:hypothetical protein
LFYRKLRDKKFYAESANNNQTQNLERKSLGSVSKTAHLHAIHAIESDIFPLLFYAKQVLDVLSNKNSKKSLIHP